jgi:hypothetical protein
MAISKLVTGTPFERPAITFSTKSADSNMQKASSSLLTNKSSMGDLADSMSRLNIQLTQLQKVSNEIMKSIASVLKTIAKVDHDMTGRFRTLNKELAASRTEFTRSLAAITPSLTGGAGATISAAALGPAAAAASSEPRSGNPIWDAFMDYVKIRAAGLFAKIGARVLVSMAGLAVPGIGWIVTALTIISSIALVYELYQLWCQFKNITPDDKEVKAAEAAKAQEGPTTPAAPPGSPQGAAIGMTEPEGSPSFKQLANGQTGAPQGGAGPAAATASAAPAAPASSTREASAEDLYKTPGSDANDPSKAAASTPTAPAAPTDMSIGGETGAFGAARQSAAAPQPMRRPADTAPAATTGAPVMAPPDPHAKSRAMFEAATEAERNGQSGTALFFAADKQRMLELENVKKAAAQPGAPVETKKAAAAPLPPRRPQIAFGAGLGMNEPQGTFGAGLGMNEPQEPSLAGLGGGETGMSDRELRSANMQNVSNNMQKEYDAKDRLAPIQDPMAEMARKMEEAKRIGALQDRQAVDDKDRANDVRYKPKEEQRAEQNAKVAAGATPAAVGMRAGPKAFGAAIGGGPEGNAENPPIVPGAGAPVASPPVQGPPPAPEGDESAGYKGKLGKILQTNMNDYNVVNKSAGGDQNVTPNLPLSATNPFLNFIFGKQKMENHQ